MVFCASNDTNGQLKVSPNEDYMRGTVFYIGDILDCMALNSLIHIMSVHVRLAWSSSDGEKTKWTTISTGASNIGWLMHDFNATFL